MREAGYATLRGFVGPAILARLRDAVETALQAPVIPGCERPHNRLVPLRWNDPVVSLLLAGAERRRAMRTVTGADDLRWISGYISVKEARTPALWWHQDWWCWDHPISFHAAPVQVAVLVYLSDTNEASGALRLLPGSHRRSVPLHGVLPGAHRHGENLPRDHAAFGDQPGQVTLSAAAGDAVVLDYRLLHGTHPNDSGARRDCILLSFAPSWRSLPSDLRAHLIQHLALPRPDERPPRARWRAELLPSFDDEPADLPLNRDAPARFAVTAQSRE